MAAKPALIKQSDVTRIMRGAQAAGITMGIVVTTGEVRFVPVDTMKPEQTLSALDRWKAEENARKAKAQGRGRS